MVAVSSRFQSDGDPPSERGSAASAEVHGQAHRRKSPTVCVGSKRPASRVPSGSRTCEAASVPEQCMPEQCMG